MGIIMSTVYTYIEYLHNFNPELLNIIADEIVDQDVSKINSPLENTDLIIGAFLERTVDDLNKIIENYTKYNFKTITLLIDWNIRNTYHQLLSETIINRCNIVPVNWWPFFSVTWLKNQNICPNSCDLDNKKGLFMTGNLSRYNRVGLLKKLYDSNLLDNILWTFPSAEKQKSNILKYFIRRHKTIPENFSEFFDFCIEHAIVDHKGNLTDKIDSLTNFTQNTVFVDGYESSGFSIVSETRDDSLTEKIYLAILYQHPFVIPNKPKTIKELKILGFKTFENYLPFSDYIDVEDDEVRLDMVIKNIEAFPGVIQQHKEEIAADVQYNHNLLHDLVSDTKEQLTNISPTLADDMLFNFRHSIYVLGINQFEKYKKQEKILFNKKFIDKYNIIKAESWPDIIDESEFYTLPQDILLECKNVFKFPPDDICDKN